MVKKKTEGDGGEKEKVNEVCPKCGSVLGEVVTAKNGRQFQRCSAGSWNPQTRQVEGCNFIKWLPFEPQHLEEKCPKCGASLVLYITRFGKKMKRCSTSSWDSETRTASGCNYIEWIKGMTEDLDENCPKCGAKLVLFTSAAGKKLKKCSTNVWNPKTRQASGCEYVEWL